MGYRRHYAILLDSKGNVIKERSNNDGDCNHAEMRALKNVDKKDYINGTMIIVRQVFNENKENVGSMSKPCKLCMNHLLHTKIKQVIYSTGDVNKPFDKLLIN
jgi:tRNA(Arg) A34 adenosine deaminase TadA